MPSKFKPPTDEEDRRLLARELFVKGKSPEEIASITNLPPETVNKIVTWLKSDQGQVWIKKRYPEGVQSSGQPETEQAVAETASETLQRAPAPPAGLPPLSQVVPGHQAKVQSTGQQPPAPRSQGQYIVLSPEQFGALVEKGVGGSLPGGSAGVVENDGSQVILREGAISMDQPALTGKFTQTFVKPWTVIWYMRMVAMGYKKDMASFIEECVTGHMKQRYGLSYAMVKEE